MVTNKPFFTWPRKYYSFTVLSVKLYFLEIGPVHQKLWPFKCMMLKTLNSNFLDWEDTLKFELYRILVINQNFCEVKDPLDTTGFKTPKKLVKKSLRSSWSWCFTQALTNERSLRSSKFLKYSFDRELFYSPYAAILNPRLLFLPWEILFDLCIRSPFKTGFEKQEPLFECQGTKKYRWM